MKKSLLAIALLGIVGTVSAETVVVNFQGQVEDQTCKVVVGQNGNTIDLGSVNSKPASKGAYAPVVFGFSECNKNSVESIKLVGSQMGTNPQTALAAGELETTTDNVIVKMYKDRAEGQYVDFNTSTAFGDDKAAKIVVGYARLEVLQSAPANAQLGPVTSNAVFEVVYK